MAEHFLIETTNETCVVEQVRVSLNQTRLSLAGRSLVRIVGLERATTLQILNVQTNQRIFWRRISRILVFVQLEDNCFVDVPACVLALTQVDFLSVSVLFILFLR